MDEQSVSQDGFQTLEEIAADVQNTQLTLFDMQSLAVKNTGTIKALQEQLKTASEMYNDTFINNATYREHAERVKEVQRGLKSVRAQIEHDPSALAQKDRIRELKSQVKEKRESVSEYALEVYRMTGQREFEQDGETYEIQTVAKLTKRKQ